MQSPEPLASHAMQSEAIACNHLSRERREVSAITIRGHQHAIT
jgi:hypothetical protein